MPHPNDVYVSDRLSDRHPAVPDNLRAVLGHRFKLISGTKDIWCRDYMPVPLLGDRFVQFRYDPDYLKEDPHLRTENAARLLGFEASCRFSDLVIDGGNVVCRGTTAILTDKVYRENPQHERPRLREMLREQLEVELLVIIPREPYEPLGHADGVLHLVDERTVLVNDYAVSEPAYGRRLGDVLRRHRFEVIPVPYCPSRQRTTDGLCSAEGVYANLVDTGDMILCPAYDRPEDEVVQRLLGRVHPSRRLVAVRCKELAVQGGALNCVTWSACRSSS